MATDLTGTTVAFLATEGVERVELTDPWDALKGAGATVHLVSPEPEVQSFDHLDKAASFPTDRKVADANPGAYDALVLPGGVANPDQLRTDEIAVGFVKAFTDAGKPVFAICHAPWTLIEADAVRGRCVTSWPSLQTDLRNAGAEWQDDELVVCEHGPGLLVTSRNPDDLPAFTAKLVEVLDGLELRATGNT
ncbi:MAG TPA: type 1 glutamine amidotransferase domain-containing protein [Aquihabitans sp.]|jgi:protease I|nr:type 1 glutamine amidotransferase domain-containing protein [Aquihabitans sp.]